MDILIAELLFDVSVGPGHQSGQNIPVSYTRSAWILPGYLL